MKALGASKIVPLFLAITIWAITGSALGNGPSSKRTDLGLSATVGPVAGNDADEALAYFLRHDCLVDKRNQVVERIVPHWETLRPVLRKIVNEGLVDTNLIAEARRSAESEWEAREKSLMARADPGLKAEHMDLLKSVSKEKFMADEAERMIRTFRERAAVGLAFIGSTSDRAYLTALRDDARQNHNFRKTIKAALLKSRGFRLPETNPSQAETAPRSPESSGPAAGSAASPSR